MQTVQHHPNKKTAVFSVPQAHRIFHPLTMDYMIKNRNHSKKNFNLILEQWMPWLGTIEETTALEEQWAEESIHYLQNKFKSLFSN